MADITKDMVYESVAPDDFESMIELDRYAARSTAFDHIISATHDHFWDPLDKKYIDFGEPFDIEHVQMMPDEQIFQLQIPYVRDHLEKTGQKVKFANEMQLWSFSSILHGEQGALNLSASLCHVLKDQGAQEYAANQTREEARHVTAFAQYIKSRWGRPRPCGIVLKQLLVDIISAPEVYKKIIGMQMLVEGLAMGAFATGYKFNQDPLAKKLFQLVMTDEAFHHKFGKIWADRTVPRMSEDERNVVEDWAAHCFQSLLFNLGSPQQQAQMYRDFGLDPEKVMEGLMALRSNGRTRERLKESTNIFRVLIKTLVKSGLVTDRTRSFYATYVDMDELKAEGDRMVGDDIAEEGIAYLKAINFKERSDAGAVKVAAE
jgi:hypothetical protein